MRYQGANHSGRTHAYRSAQIGLDADAHRCHSPFCYHGITGILSRSVARRFLVLASFSLRSAAHV
ncbi:MAG: hypothetical protein ABJB12_19850, partial [Pseudomonadota bacterium]